MSRIKTWVFVAVALAFISTVTIFDPAYISDAFLSRLIPPKAGLQDEDVTVRVTFSKPPSADAATVVVSDVRDPAGNVMKKAHEAPVEAVDDVPPQVTGHAVHATDGSLVIVLGFDEPVRDVLKPASSFSLTVDEAGDVDLSEASVSYDPETYLLKLEVPSPGAVSAGVPYLMSVQGIEDLSGNLLEHERLEGSLFSGVQPVTASFARLKLEDDESGKTVEVIFSGPLNVDSAGSILAYRLSSGELPRRVRMPAGGDRVLLELKEPAVPGDVTLEIKGLSDASGGPVARAAALEILPGENVPPRVVAAVAEAVEGFANDLVALTFSEPLTPADAMDPQNYSLESPVGTEIPLAGASVSYDSSGRKVTIKLVAAELVPLTPFKMEIKGVRDVSGNAMEARVIEGTVIGDTDPPAVDEVVQNLYADETGATVDVRLSEAVMENFLSDAANFRIDGPQAPVLLRPSKDRRSVRITYDRPLVPGEVTFTVGELADPAGNRSENQSASLEPSEVKPPLVLGTTCEAIPGLDNDRLTVTFNEALLRAEAENPSNYALQSPPGRSVSLAHAAVTYVAGSHQVEIELKGENLTVGDEYTLFVTGVKDTGGNAIRQTVTSSGIVEGDTEAPRVAWAKAMRTGDAEGTDILVKFNEAIAAASIREATIEGPRPTRGPATISADGTALTLRFETMRLVGTWAQGWVYALELAVLILGLWLLAAGRKARRKAGAIAAVIGAGLLLFSGVTRSANTIVISQVSDPAGNVAYSLKAGISAGHAEVAQALAPESGEETEGTAPKPVAARHLLKSSQRFVNKALQERKHHFKVTAIDGGAVDVIFDAPLDQSSAEDVNSYYLNDEVDVQRRPLLAIVLKDERTVRLYFPRVLIPGSDTLLVRNVSGKAGPPMDPRVVSGVALEPAETTPPTVTGGRATVASGPDNDTVTVFYSEPVIEAAATKPGNFAIESPPGTDVSPAGAELSYVKGLSATSIKLKTPLRYGERFRVQASGIKDMSGNPLAEPSAFEGTVQGDKRPPALIKAVKNTSADPSGATIDLLFSEAVDPVSSTDTTNYRLADAQALPLRAEVVKKVAAPRDEELLHQMDLISEAELASLLKEFTSFPKGSDYKTRTVGYGGDQEAAEFIAEEFRRIGLRQGRWRDSKVGATIETFPVTVPVDKGAEIETQDGDKIGVFCLWPNHVRTSSLPGEGVSGELIYVGKGDFSAYNGHDMDAGPIVVMDFNSANNYVKARWLGAKAIIFIPEDPSKVVQGEAYTKFLQVPVDIPRFWANEEDAEKLKGLSGEQVRLRARMDWETVEAKNIYAWIPGVNEELPTSTKDEPDLWADHVIVVEAYYDSMSIVPRLSPGAENACGIAALLRLAETLMAYEPKYTVLFLATSGHFEGLEGAFDFVYRHSREESDFYKKRIPQEQKIAFDLMVSLDLSSKNDQVAVFSEGNYVKYLWEYATLRKNVVSPYVGKFLEYAAEVAPGTPPKFIDAVSPKGRSWRTYMPTLLGLDHEAAHITGNTAVSFVTPHDLRERVDTPYDRMEEVNIANLTSQVRTIAGLLMKAGRDEEFFAGSKIELTDLGRALSGNVVWFDRDVNFFVPKAPLGNAVVAYESVKANEPRVKSYGGVRTLETVQTADGDPGWEDGTRGYELVPITANARRFEVRMWDRSIEAPSSGSVTVATPHGVFDYELSDDEGDGVWTAQVNVEKKRHSVGSAYGVICVFGPVFLIGFLLYRKRDLSLAARRLSGAIALLAVAIMLGWVGFIMFQEDLVPAGTEINPGALEPTVKALRLAGADGKAFVLREDIPAYFGDFRGQFRFPVKINQLDNTITAYVLGEDGEIRYAPDRGEEGDKTYPMKQPFGWWESEMLQVLFPCRALSLFEAVDSRYLTVLDSMVVLGEDEATPQWYGYDYVSGQSMVEGEAVDAAVVYAKREPGRGPSRVKILMSTGLLGIKYLLTNAPERLLEEPVEPQEVTPELLAAARGKGYQSDRGVLFRPSFLGAKDMWVLDDVRMKQLEAYRIRNQKLRLLHERAREALMAAKRHWEDRKYDQFVTASREAAGIETRGYPDVKKTANDTVKGVIFYFVLLLPFSMFVERLVFGFVDIRKRIAGFAGVFVLVFIVLHFVHPAFKLSSSPYIIFLAFVMLALGGVVLTIVLSKFNLEVKKIKRAAAGVYEADVGRLSATAAAVMLGISNLRKRKVRTSLTAATLTLLTFTVLSFTSVVTSMKYYRLPRPNFPVYQGMLVRDRNWRALQPSVPDYVKSAFEGKATVVPRAWYIAKVRTETEVIDLRNPATGQTTTASGLLGMTPDETLATRPDQLLIGERSDWLRANDYKVCILPNDMAELLGITPDMAGREGGARIWMLGSELKVIGLMDAERFNKLRGLDDEKLTPVDMAAEATRVEEGMRESPDLAAAEPIQAFAHLESSNVAIVPYNFLIERGGTPRSMAVTGFETGVLVDEVEDFLSRVAMTVFVGKDDNVTAYSSMGATSIRGSANLIVPILIASLIVLNTMLGAVYERMNEIGIYSSVGLAPTHVGALFLAEAAVFATLGAVLGYLIGQVATLVLAKSGLLSGMFLNYSSLSAVWSTMVVMATVMLSTIYPAKKAADLAVPDVTRRWKIPEPKGDEWVFDFPFTMSGKEVLGMHTYLAKVFDTYTEGSTGGFVAEGVKLDARMVEREPEYVLSMRCWLAPYDLGISQNVVLMAIPTGEFNIYKIEVHLIRLSGDVASWKRINRGFLNMLRKRFLVWRTVPPGEKDRYQKEGEELLASRLRAGSSR